MWGTGVDDHSTFLLFSSQFVNGNGGSCAVVVNCGEGGYVSSQDLNSFVNNLRTGKASRHCSFYWGINDSYVACQGLTPSSPQFLPLLESRMNKRNNGRLGLAMRFLASTKTFSCLRSLTQAWWNLPSIPPVSNKVIREHVDVLLSNLILIKQIGEAKRRRNTVRASAMPH